MLPIQLEPPQSYRQRFDEKQFRRIWQRFAWPRRYWMRLSCAIQSTPLNTLSNPTRCPGCSPRSLKKCPESNVFSVPTLDRRTAGRSPLDEMGASRSRPGALLQTTTKTEVPHTVPLPAQFVSWLQKLPCLAAQYEDDRPRPPSPGEPFCRSVSLAGFIEQHSQLDFDRRWRSSSRRRTSRDSVSSLSPSARCQEGESTGIDSLAC